MKIRDTERDRRALELMWAAAEVIRRTEKNYQQWAASAGQPEDPEVLQGLIVDNLAGALPETGPHYRISEALGEVNIACALEDCGACPLRFNEDCEPLRIGMALADYKV